MPSQFQLTLYERNDETLDCVVSDAAGNPLDLTGLDLEFFIKTSASEADGTPLSTTAGDITITDAAAGKATVESPAARQVTTAKFHRLDVLDAGKRKTASFGSLTVVNL